MRDHSHPAVAFHAVALVAAARSALNAARQIGDRRAGRDASEQEPVGSARADLGELWAELGAHVVRLRLRVVTGVPESPAAALAQAFEDRTLLDDLGRTVGVIHQKLLSLYPAVGEVVVEEARRLAVEARRRAVADAYDVGLAAFVARVSDLRDALRDTLGEGV
ncbi:hypothetical protein [Rubrivirga sp.]|uniref:hypothetical protein n=1 Tax=Rubrivirga sp. TaxID=1885344 RepID=UPI003B51F112